MWASHTIQRNYGEGKYLLYYRNIITIIIDFVYDNAKS